MSDYKIRIANIEDTFNLYQLNKECLPLYYQPLEYMIMLMSGYIILVMEDQNNNIVGYSVNQYQDNRCHILSIGIKQDLRSKGLGKIMLEYLYDIAKNNKSEFLSLYVHFDNTKGINFYKKNNFNVQSEKINYYNYIEGYKSRNAYFMIKKIN